MNNTNRALNRTIVLVVGILCLAIGAAIVAIVTIDAVRTPYVQNARQVHGTITGWLKTTILPGSGVAWGWILAVAALAVLVILLVIFAVRQGHGHHGTLLREQTGPAGMTIVDSNVAEQVLQQDIDGNSDFLASHVSTYRVRGTTVLKVSVTCRRGISPRSAVDLLQGSLNRLDELLGREIPALIQVSGGFRSRVAPPTRTR